MPIEYKVNLSGLDAALKELPRWAAHASRLTAKRAPRSAKQRMRRVVRDRTAFSRTSIVAYARKDNALLVGFGGTIWTHKRIPFMQRALKREARLAAREAAERAALRIEVFVNGR